MDMSSLKKYEKDIYLCTTCRDGGCGILCPDFDVLGFESSTPRGKMRIARGLLEGRLEITEALIRTIYTCTGCGYCATRCSNNPHDVMLALRSHLIEAGKAHDGYAPIFDSIRKNHNRVLCGIPISMDTTESNRYYGQGWRKVDYIRTGRVVLW